MQSGSSDEAAMAELAKLVGSDPELKSAQDLYQGQDMVKLVRTYLEEEEPEAYKKNPLFTEFWAILSKNIKLSFLDGKYDVEDFEILFDQSKLNYVMSKPPYEFNWEDMQLLEQLKINFLASVKRAVGVSGHRFNERIILGGTINQVIRSNTESIKAGDSGGGFMSKLRSIF